MNRPRRLWMWAFSLLMPLMSACVVKGDDFLYVLATPPGQRSEILWIPVDAPESARVLVEDLDQTDFLHRHCDELWWWTEERPVMGDLVGQSEDRLSEYGGNRVSNIVRQGDRLYWTSGAQLGSFNLRTRSSEVLVAGGEDEAIQITGSFLFFGSGQSELRGLAVYEDRLYFGDGPTVDSIRLDGSDRQQVVARDEETDLGISITEGVLRFPLGFGSGFGFGVGTRGLAVHRDHLIWVKEQAFWQMNLKTGEESRLSGVLPERVHAMAVTDEAIYWIDARNVWRWKLGGDTHEPIYELGDTLFSGISAVTAEPRTSWIWDQERVGVIAEEEGVYQLLFSEDLQSWSPDFVRQSLFNENGRLSWLSPKLGGEGEPLVWHAKLSDRQGYFAAWQYDLGEAFDSDGDELPDYWERRHFNDLSPVPNEDSNGDGLTYLEEARLLLGPHETDADGDGLSNAEEVAYVPPLNPVSRDTDGDTLSDGDEVNVHGTDPHSNDTDGDGFADDFEVAFGGDPLESGTGPSRDLVLAEYEADLMVHFDFEPSAGKSIVNKGQLGGFGRLVGEASYVTREGDRDEGSRALSLVVDPNEESLAAHVETDYRLGDLGLATLGEGVTISFWVRAEKAQRGTLLSAARPGGDGQALSVRLLDPSQGDGIPLRFSLKGSRFNWSTTTENMVPVGKWTHVVLRSESGSWGIYVDGIQRSIRGSGGGLLEEDPKLWLGAQQGSLGANTPFLGAIDDLRIYRRLLPENAIKVLAR